MAQYNFEGGFDDINERQLEFINKVIQEQDLQVTKVVFSPVGQAGDNFVANVKRISIEGKNGSMKMIAKIASAHGLVPKMSNNNEFIFNNEQTMYTEVLPKLVQLQKDVGVTEEEQLKYAKCYGALTEAPNEVILLEDLKELDFVMLNKFDSLSDDCVKSVLKNFALLHSLSFALKKIEPETYDLFKSKLTDAWLLLAENQKMLQLLQVVETEILSVFDERSCAPISLDNRRSTSEDTVQSIMIDYQAPKDISPVVDLLYMIFNCTDHETRSKHYYNWLDYCHSELDKSLANFGLNVNLVCPRDQMDTDMKTYSPFIFGLSLTLANLLTRDTVEASKLMDARQSSDRVV